ncbi:MAG TPA: HD-GYP domain-containing protein [Azospira sp.]|nr:HD-GYP domain-containing protein [Azospira sp.]
MNPIHGIVLRRLAAAWIILSLLFGGVTYYLGVDQLDRRVVALATSEAERFAALGIPLDAPLGDAAARELAARTKEFVREHFVVVEIYDRARKKLVEAVNPRHQALEHELSRRGHAFPADDRPHYERLQLLDSTLVQILVPLREAAGERGGDRSGNIAGYFEGVYVVAPETVASLRAELMRALAITLFAVLLTTVALYPVILSLNRKVLGFSREVVQGNLEMASVLGSAIAKRDSDTNEHNYRVTLYAIALGEAVGLDATAMRALILGAFLHDVGKIGISDNILLKPGKLSDEEFAVMRTHVELGVDILRDSEWLRAALDVVGNHHEKFDGSGYPNRLAGEAIPLNARIFAIVDVFDALASERPYKRAMSCDAALAILAEGSGRHFDPRLVQQFAALAPTLHRQYASGDEADLARLQQILRDKGLHYFFAASRLKAA